MKTYIYGYNNCISFVIDANSEAEAYTKLVDKIEIIQFGYKCQLPDVNCFDLITCY